MDGLGGDGFGFDSQVGRARGGRGRVVAAVVLHETAIDAGCEQMRRPRVAQRVHRGALRDTAGLQSSAQGILHAVARHGGGGGGHPTPASARCWKKPPRMAVGSPVVAEQREGLLGQRHRAVLRACAMAHVDDQPGTSTIGHLQVGAFLKSQATGREGTQADTLPWQPHRLKDRAYFVDAEDDGQLVLLRWPHEGQ